MEIFKRPRSNKWQSYCYYFDGSKRRRVLKSTGIVDDGTAKSRQTAEAVARDIERALAVGGEAATRPGKTLGQALRSLSEASELAGLVDDTLISIENRGASLVSHFGTQQRLDAITTERLRQYAIEARKVRSAVTVSREFIVLGQAFKVVEMTPPKFPELGDKSPKAQRVLELDEQRALLLAMPSTRRLVVMTYLKLGLRLSEPWKITEIDWEQRFAHVNGTKTKGSKRDVPIPDELYEQLLPMKGTWAGFKHWRLRDVDRALRKGGVRAGICEDLSVNDLRGTYATFMARAGVPILTLAKIMGNSVAMLEKVYSQVGVRGPHLHEAAAKLPRLTPAAPTTPNLTTWRRGS